MTMLGTTPESANQPPIGGLFLNRQELQTTGSLVRTYPERVLQASLARRALTALVPPNDPHRVAIAAAIHHEYLQRARGGTLDGMAPMSLRRAQTHERLRSRAQDGPDAVALVVQTSGELMGRYVELNSRDYRHPVLDAIAGVYDITEYPHDQHRYLQTRVLDGPQVHFTDGTLPDYEKQRHAGPNDHLAFLQRCVTVTRQHLPTQLTLGL